jgi:hypothetical protein
LEEKLFSTRDNVEIHIQRPFFDNRKGIPQIVALEIQMVSTSFGASSLSRYFLFPRKIEISTFGGILKFLKLIVFGQILTKFNRNGQFWADSAAMAEADSMPSCEKNP